MKGDYMERLTSNKETKDMTMIELAHNSCYADSQRNARYRDYNLDIDSRQLVRNLLKDICDEDLAECTDEEFEEYMSEMLSLEIDSKIGLLALFYRNLWAMADLREKLKEFEDLEELIGIPLKKIAEIFNNNIPEECKYPKKAIALTDDDVDRWHVYKNAEEQGLLLRLPCKNWMDIVFGKQETFFGIDESYIENPIREITVDSADRFTWYDGWKTLVLNGADENGLDWEFSPEDIGKTVFLTKAEAEQKLKEMEVIKC